MEFAIVIFKVFALILLFQGAGDETLNLSAEVDRANEGETAGAAAGPESGSVQITGQCLIGRFGLTHFQNCKTKPATKIRKQNNSLKIALINSQLETLQNTHAIKCDSEKGLAVAVQL